PHRVSLPTYPFAKERYWLTPEERVTAAAPKVAPQEAMEVLTFEETWEAAPLAAHGAASPKLLLCFASDPVFQNRFEAEARRRHPATRIVFVAHRSDAATAVAHNVHVIDRADRRAYAQVLAQMQAGDTPVDAVVYMWGAEAPAGGADHQAIVYLLQSLGALKRPIGVVVLAAQLSGTDDDAHFASWAGYERSASLVLPATAVTVLSQDTTGAAAPDRWAALLCDELAVTPQRGVLYRGDVRHIGRTRRTNLADGPSALRHGGTYLITGGLGGLGYLFAEYLSRSYGANLVLTGRSALDTKRQAALAALDGGIGRALYLQADVCDAVDMAAVVAAAKQRFGRIDGVIHAAGTVDAGHLLDKDWPAFERVLAPKIAGSQVLAEVLRHETPDFVCHFSSAAAMLGDFGSCDYAVGNCYQTAFAGLASHATRQVAINWPLWADGGMSVGDQTQTALYLASSGQRALTVDEGIAVFERILAQNRNQHLVLVTQPGRAARIVPSLAGPTSRAPQAERAAVATPGERFKADLAALAAELLKLPVERLDPEASLSDFGFDSISLSRYARELVERFEIGVTPATFFAHSTLDRLHQHCLREYGAKLEAHYGRLAADPDPESEPVPVPVPAAPPAAAQEALPAAHREAVAIIGMSGRFPGARDIDEMWSILASGRDVVGRAPSDRPGPWRDTDARCGFVPGVAEFDPLFFGISPMEAKLIDPRQRLLLQEAWNALEDAGYGRQHTKGRNIGMFVGVEEGDYHRVGAGGGNITSNHNGVLAARLAYLLDCSGPTMAINAACASGLVALHQACRSLLADECETAIAAGVSLMLTPTALELMREAGMLSPAQQCRAFDEGADGMVPSEAVTAVVLKRLSQALADGDPIHAVIEASGINSDGKTNGITAPNGSAQAALLKSVYRRGGIDPARIGYAIAHGTGTPLGDPVELNALQEAFSAPGGKRHFCALTSTKGNFGHTLAASGLVSLIAMVQSLRHGVIPPTLHCGRESAYFDWASSAFYVNKTLRPWPLAEGAPRTGAVSAFGMSGTNCHVVLSEAPRRQASAGRAAARVLLVLSARTEAALRAKLLALRAALVASAEAPCLTSLSYTLLVGRQHFRHRVALVVGDAAQAVTALQALLDGGAVDGARSGQARDGLVTDSATRERVRALGERSRTYRDDPAASGGALLELASLYCEGHTVGWSDDSVPHRLHMPTYPFSRETHWADERAGAGATGPTPVPVPVPVPAPEAGGREDFYGSLLKAVQDDSLSVKDAVSAIRRQGAEPTPNSSAYAS
ncbi:MAG: type I polyketide synthase, partial [Pseudomonadota bacterium]